MIFSRLQLPFLFAAYANGAAYAAGCRGLPILHFRYLSARVGVVGSPFCFRVNFRSLAGGFMVHGWSSWNEIMN